MMFASDEETAKLLRDATAYAKVGQQDKAISALCAAKQRMLVSSVHYPTETWCRLPLYLQKAARFDESMKEFDWLLADLERRARREAYLDKPSIQTAAPKLQIFNSLMKEGKEIIEEKRILATKREQKRFGLVAK